MNNKPQPPYYFVFIYTKHGIQFTSNAGFSGNQPHDAIMSKFNHYDLWVDNYLKSHHVSFSDTKYYEIIDNRNI